MTSVIKVTPLLCVKHNSYLQAYGKNTLINTVIFTSIRGPVMDNFTPQ